MLVDNQDAGLELFKQGLSWVYARYLPEASPDIQASYQQAQAGWRRTRFDGVARSLRANFWLLPHTEPKIQVAGLELLNKVFAGCTKSASVKRRLRVQAGYREARAAAQSEKGYPSDEPQAHGTIVFLALRLRQ